MCVCVFACCFLVSHSVGAFRCTRTYQRVVVCGMAVCMHAMDRCVMVHCGVLPSTANVIITHCFTCADAQAAEIASMEEPEAIVGAIK